MSKLPRVKSSLSSLSRDSNFGGQVESDGRQYLRMAAAISDCDFMGVLNGGVTQPTAMAMAITPTMIKIIKPLIRISYWLGFKKALIRVANRLILLIPVIGL
ncbi:unnamed protein product [Citrullus colocynthis]|uniref:Uncharacterized protein n=1 Tax=Citrullus colocynthis TaxID=252529 RepID=A0ABP0Z4P0_9ROSI